MINFGKYDQKVSFVTLGKVADGYGGFTPAETIALTTFANVRQLKGSNDLEAAQMGLPKTYRIGVQHRSGFEPNVTMQITYRGVAHVIKSVEESVERNTREWIITAVRA